MSNQSLTDIRLSCSDEKILFDTGREVGDEWSWYCFLTQNCCFILYEKSCIRTLKKGIDLLSFSSNGSSSKHWVCTYEGDDTSILKALNSVNPYALYEVDNKGRTPLHYAPNAGSLPRVQCLLAMGAVPDSKDCDQKTPADVTDIESIQIELRSALTLTLLGARAIQANEALYAQRSLFPEVMRDLVQEQGSANVGYLCYCHLKASSDARSFNVRVRLAPC